MDEHIEEVAGSSNEIPVLKNCQDVFKAVVSASKCAKSLPSIGADYELYSSYPAFAELMKAEADRLSSLMTKILKHAGAKINLNDALLLDERTELLIDANDSLLERVGNLLDEAVGLRKPSDLVVVGSDRKAPLRHINTSWNRSLHQKDAGNSSKTTEGESTTANSDSATHASAKSAFSVRLLAAYHVSRPQTNFADTINNRNAPFVPNLRVKHNALLQTRSNVKVIVNNDVADQFGMDEQPEIHPYKYELDRFEPKPEQLEESTVQEPKPLNETPLVFVSTKEQLLELCSTLKAEKEFAVDVEHHSYRTFQGLTCLIQISTRTHDYIIDTLALWREIHILNDPFTDPNIVKVFHGADFDVQWLQRDFGIYVVNMFDTGQAMRLLSFARYSLLYLYRHYCPEVILSKQYQLADWRIRPLPSELRDYARQDTHYLLYCYDCLRRDLLAAGNNQQNLLRSTYVRSRDICLKTWEKRLCKPEDHLALLDKSGKRFNTRQRYALEKLYAWRDNLARTEDESLAFVLPDHMLLQIAEVLPREIQGIWACCSPVPPLVRQESQTLHRIILEARSVPLESAQTQKAAQDVDLATATTQKTLKKQRFDFSHSAENEEIVPLSQRLATVEQFAPEIERPTLKLFEAPAVTKPSKKSQKTNITRSTTVFSLYQLYLQAMELKLRLLKQSTAKTPENNQDAKRTFVLQTYEKDNSTGVEEESEVQEVPVAKKQRIDQELSEFTGKTKKKKNKRPKPTIPFVRSFDYAAANKNVFNEGPSEERRQKVFDPNKALTKKGKWKSQNAKPDGQSANFSGKNRGKPAKRGQGKRKL